MGEKTEENANATHESLNLEHLSLTSSNVSECGSKETDLDNTVTHDDEELDTSTINQTNSQEECEPDIDDLAKEAKSDEDYTNCELVNDDDDVIKRKGGHSRKLDSEPEDEGVEYSNKSNKENVHKSLKSRSKKMKDKVSIKKTKKQIKEERFKIQSETHRLMREREVTIPYHVPKQRTLREFLSRKKNRANIPLNAPTSKMVEIWKDIEESTKSAFEFFKSESESDSEACKENSLNEKSQQTNDVVKGSFNTDNSGLNCVLESNSNGIPALDGEKSEMLVNTVEVPEMTRESHEVLECGAENSGYIGEVNKTEGEVMESKESDVTGLCGCVDSIEQNDIQIVSTNEGSENIFEASIDENYRREKTSEWVNNIQEYEKFLKPNKKEKLLEKLNPKLLKITPKLSGAPDSFIELGNDKNSIEAGAKNLKKRFLENCTPLRPKNTEIELTITSAETTDKGAVNNIKTEKLIYSSKETFSDPSLEKPGAKLQRLREELKKKIEEKWEVEQKRQTMELELETVNKEKIVSDDEEEEEILTDESSEESDVEEVDSEEEDEIRETKKSKKNEFIDDEAESDDEDDISEDDDEELNEKQSKKKKNKFVDDEAEESDADDEDSREADLDVDEASRNIDDKSCDAPGQKTSFNMYSDSQSSLIPPYQPGGGMLHGGSELTQCDDDSVLPKNLLSPALRLSLDLSPATKTGNNTESQQTWDLDLDSPEEANNKSSFVPCFPENGNFDLNDAYEFCSGKFPDEGGGSLDCQSQDSQGLSCDSRPETVGEMQKATGEAKKKLSRVEILTDDSEDEAAPELDNLDEADITAKRISSGESDDEENAPVKSKKKRKHLKFSDDEDDENEEDEEEEEKEEDSDSEESDSKDNEENEVEDSSQNEQPEKEVMYDSEEEIVNPGEFFEKEAELSGSEEWSGDEDEGGLDDYEKEDGDADKLDEHKVRSDLEKIHMRTLRDDDERQVRLLQEILFEDGDLHDDGPKRPKNFRWKDIGGFYDDDEDRTELFKPQDDEQEEDEQSAKIRHEKELFWLKLKSRREEVGLDDDEHGSSLLKLGKVVMEKSTRITMSKERVRTTTADIDESIVKTPFALTNQRGSFLSRNEEFLSRLAKFTANATDNILGPKHSKNFVFASRSPEKAPPPSKENSQPKRKNGSPKNEKNKKPRLESEVAKVSVLDYLS
ncbi:UNVERIFIED_CONTAM: hypothetical protein PYX00_007119 [Menopon gallinae]|uniref:Claspin n=1 Tax=Menopon gallinae TaxID=328185 RepID=A0AAW2HHP7_9NEOP